MIDEWEEIEKIGETINNKLIEKIKFALSVLVIVVAWIVCTFIAITFLNVTWGMALFISFMALFIFSMIVCMVHLTIAVFTLPYDGL